MRILLAHNYYQQPGGEDRVFEADCAMLESRGHEVVRFTMHNDTVTALSALRLARITLWNRDAYHAVEGLVRRHRIQIAHFHNTLPLVSPSALYAAHAAGAAVVHTLHNYRLACPAAVLFRDGRRCDLCARRFFAWPGVLHACYRGSRGASAAVAAMVAFHRAMGTWRRSVDAYIAPSRWARRTLLRAGLPPAKVVVRPNFVHTAPAPGDGDGGFAMFAGRLSPEKGIQTLLEAWRYLHSLIPLRIAGDGPMAPSVASAGICGVQWVGRLAPQAVTGMMGRAAFVVVPSVCEETFGMSAVEALACGTPVVASRIGALGEIIEHQHTGMLFRPGDAADLIACVRWLLACPSRLAAMRVEARRAFEAAYTADVAYAKTLLLYERLATQNSRNTP